MKIKPDNRFAMLNEQPADFFKLIPQTGVEHIMVKEWPTHNAIWDMAVSPEKTIFFSICGESYVAEYARLYEYNPKTKEMKLHFKLEEIYGAAMDFSQNDELFVKKISQIENILEL